MATVDNFYGNLISEKHTAVKSAVDHLFQVLAGEDASSKQSYASATRQCLENLRTVLAQQLVPSWLDEAKGQLDAFVSGNWNAATFIGRFLETRGKIAQHEWDFGASSPAAFDFDAVFNQYKAANRIPELFGEIIGALEQMHAEGHIDSRATMEALERVISTLKRGKDGSYFAVDGAWRFFMSFMENFLWEQLQIIPMLGPAVKALRDTIRATNESMTKVRSDVKLAIQSAAQKEASDFRARVGLPALTYSPSLPPRLGSFLDESA